MADLQKIAEAAREYVRILSITGQRHSSRESLMFCEAVEAADAPALTTLLVTPGEHVSITTPEQIADEPADTTPASEA